MRFLKTALQKDIDWKHAGLGVLAIDIFGVLWTLAWGIWDYTHEAYIWAALMLVLFGINVFITTRFAKTMSHGIFNHPPRMLVHTMWKWLTSKHVRDVMADMYNSLDLFEIEPEMMVIGRETDTFIVGWNDEEHGKLGIGIGADGTEVVFAHLGCPILNKSKHTFESLLAFSQNRGKMTDHTAHGTDVLREAFDELFGGDE